jgi:predicted nucleic-acid-binding Zn-ribbon protein
MNEVVTCPKCHGRGTKQEVALAGTSTEYLMDAHASIYRPIRINVACMFCGGKKKVLKTTTYTQLGEEKCQEDVCFTNQN